MKKKELFAILTPDWQKGFYIIAYFLFFSILEILPFGNYPQLVLAWPMYIFPYWLAAIIEVLFVYLVASAIDFLQKAHGIGMVKRKSKKKST